MHSETDAAPAHNLWYVIERGGNLWDTFIMPSEYFAGMVCWPTWEEARDYTVAYLDRVLEQQQYSTEYKNLIRADIGLQPYPLHPGNEQVESSIRDYIATLRQDIAESSSWSHYAERRIYNDPKHALALFQQVLNFRIFH